ncbi:MAG: hypothetical protein ACSLFH_09600 [Desulfuromonadales bacterium]
MKLMPSSKVMVCLLLAAFLTASAGNVFGYAWCVGDDGHVGIDVFTDKSCCADDFQGDKAVRSDLSAISQSSEHCGLCLDFSAQQSDAVFLKRLKRIPTTSSDTVSPKSHTQIAPRNDNLVVGHLMPRFQPRISQTMLAHRTVVLRN